MEKVFFTLPAADTAGAAPPAVAGAALPAVAAAQAVATAISTAAAGGGAGGIEQPASGTQSPNSSIHAAAARRSLILGHSGARLR